MSTVEISRRELENLEDPSPAPASITEVKHLSSYNWIETRRPTIVVPGSPPLWTPSTVPQKLAQDSGRFYISQNAARHPDSPLEPLFRALYTTDPSFDIQSIDVVTDRNNIRKLLSFVNPRITKLKKSIFTIKVEIRGNTALFSREEKYNYENIKPGQRAGYGHGFEKAYTSSSIRGSTGHHRILSYRFGGMNFIVRHETDGYISSNQHGCNPESDNRESDDLFKGLKNLTLSPAGVATQKHYSSIITGTKLNVKEGGEVIPLESTLEIKTRNLKNRLDFREVAPQLWISQTPRLVLAYHDNGYFKVPEVEDLTAKLKKWEEDHQDDLRKLAVLIRKIIKTVKACGGKAILNAEVKEGKLMVRKLDEKLMLPIDLYSKWNDGMDNLRTQSSVEGVTGAQAATMPTFQTKTKLKGNRRRPGSKSGDYKHS